MSCAGTPYYATTITMWRWGIALLLSLLWLSEGLAWIPAGSTLLGRDVAGTPTLLCRRFSRHCGREGAGARGGEGARLRGAVRGFSMVLAAAAASTEWKTGKMKVPFPASPPVSLILQHLGLVLGRENVGIPVAGAGVRLLPAREASPIADRGLGQEKNGLGLGEGGVPASPRRRKSHVKIASL